MKRALLMVSILPAALFAANLARNGQPVGFLRVTVVPDHAALYVDGQYWGPAERYGTPRKYLITPGQHEIKIVDPRCQDATKTVTVEPGKTAKFSEKLTRKAGPEGPYGTLKVKSPGRKLAAVMLNNEYVGYVDEFSGAGQGLEVSPGTYQVRVDVAGGESLLWQNVKLEAGKTTEVKWDY